VAIVGSSAKVTRFDVLKGRRVVLRGRLRRAPGTAAPWRRAFRADLTKLRAPGRYVVRVGRLRSRPWVVRADGSRAVISTALGFFEANRDGNEPSTVHGPAHLNDAVVESGPYAGRRFDLTGGWMDAGDTLKFAGPTAFSTIALQVGARLDPAVATRLNQEADVGVRFLLKLHPAPDLFIAQVGRTAVDHDRGPPEWYDPAGDDESSVAGIRQRTASIGVGSDYAGKVAVALAMASDRASGTARDDLIAAATAWYEYGGAIERPSDKLDEAYPETVWVDDMGAGAAALHRSTGDPQYLADALDYLKGSEPGAGWSWDSSAPLAAADLCGVLGAPPVADESARAAACDVLRAELTAAKAKLDDRALGPPATLSWGSITPGGGVGALAAAAGRAGVFPGGEVIGTRARDWLLGLNPWGASFIAGSGPLAPRQIHHWAGRLGRGLPKGAVVGGPAPASTFREQKLVLPRGGRFGSFNSAGAAYDDSEANYVTSEPAIDYTAAQVVLLAALRP
jgi:endoglucanase